MKIILYLLSFSILRTILEDFIPHHDVSSIICPRVLTRPQFHTYWIVRISYDLMLRLWEEGAAQYSPATDQMKFDILFEPCFIGPLMLRYTTHLEALDGQRPAHKINTWIYKYQPDRLVWEENNNKS